jgi:Ca2+-binding RTX toxin-like protein
VKTWNSGFKAEITLTNTGTEPIVDWQLIFDFSPDIEDIWRADIVSQDGDQYVVAGKSYTDILAPGESITFSFKATGDPDVQPVFRIDDDLPGPGGGGGDGTPAEQPGPDGGGSPAPEPPQNDGPAIEVAAGTSASALQGIIESASPGAVIRLSAGEFVFDRTVRIERDDITVEGAGSAQTKIITDFAAGDEGPAFALMSSGLSGRFGLSQDALEGDTTLHLESGHGLGAGDFVWLEAPNTQEFFDEIGDTSWLKSKPLRTSIARVTEVNGDTLTLENGIHFDYGASEATIRRLDMVEDVTLRGFSIVTRLGEPDPADFSNTLPGFDRVAAVHFVGTYNARLADIEVHDSGSKAFLFEKTLAMAADELLADGSHNKGSGGNGYAFELKDVYESNLTNLEDHGMRHSLVMGSWYSAVNNTAHVKFTDRDINFHGGRDHDNVVTVDVSERIEANDVMSSVLSYNTEGESWGAPTDPDANTITFGQVLGSKRNDEIQGNDSGVYFDGRGGHDRLTGAEGDDTLVGGAGNDVLSGLGGNDTAVFSGDQADYDISAMSDGGLSVDGPDGGDALYGIEWLKFDGGDPVLVLGFGVDGGSTPPDAAPGPGAGSPIVLSRTDGNDTFLVESTGTLVQAGAGWDHVDSSVDYVMDPEVESLTLVGSASIDGTGNDSRNVIRGNDSRNILKGEGGNDELWARPGDDVLYGGAGDDALHGQDGNDVLMGGGGIDSVEGGRGADLFRFDNSHESMPGAPDKVTDFDAGEGDRIDLSRFDANSGTAEHDVFAFIADRAFSGMAGELRFGDQVLAADLDGDGVEDFAVQIVGVGTISQDEIVA